MKKILALSIALTISSVSASAAPFLIADADQNATDCTYTNQAGTKFTAPVVVDTVRGNPANGNRVCKFDVASAPTGVNNVKVNNSNSVWQVTSVDVPFAFTPVSSLTGPSGSRVVP